MSDFLQTMASSSRERAAAAQPMQASEFDRPVVPLQLCDFDLIAELKNRSPAEGLLATADGGSDAERESRAAAYAAGGAAAISVLTEPSRFDGSLEHLSVVAAAAPTTPIMRKDFLVDPVQVLEGRKAGASGVLLIAAMLDDATLRIMLDCAFEHGMFVLLEAFDKDDLRRSSLLLETARYADQAEAAQLLIGVNTRNLRTLEVDANRLQALAPLLPNARCVAESGLHDAADAERVAGWGYQMALVGTALMRSDDPAALISAMRAAGS